MATALEKKQAQLDKAYEGLKAGGLSDSEIKASKGYKMIEDQVSKISSKVPTGGAYNISEPYGESIGGYKDKNGEFVVTNQSTYGTPPSGKNSTPQQSAGLQTYTNSLGTQVSGPGVQGANVSFNPNVLNATGKEDFGYSDVYQPILDPLNEQQGLLSQQNSLGLEQINKDYADLFNSFNTQEKQALSGLDYDPETGIFKGLSKDEKNRISAPFKEAEAFQALQAKDRTTDLKFARNESLSALASEKRRTEKTLASQELARETFAGLTGAFGSSRTFEYLQEKEMEGTQILNEIDEKRASYSQYYSDKIDGIMEEYQLNVGSLKRQTAELQNNRYNELVSQVDKIRSDKSSSITQKGLDIKKLNLDYVFAANDLAGKVGNVLSDYYKSVKNASDKAIAEDTALRDTVGQSILETYDSIVPGFVPSPGKVAEFTKTIYEGLKLYQTSGGTEGYANLQSGLADLMSAIKSNSAVFNKYNPAMQPKKGSGGGGGGGSASTGGPIGVDDITWLSTSYYFGLSEGEKKALAVQLNQGIESGQYDSVEAALKDLGKQFETGINTKAAPYTAGAVTYNLPSGPPKQSSGVAEQFFSFFSGGGSSGSSSGSKASSGKDFVSDTNKKVK